MEIKMMNTPSVYQYLYMHSFSLNYHFTVMIAYNGYVEVNILVNPFCPHKNKKNISILFCIDFLSC